MIKLEMSARHVHVTREDLDVLYGKDYKLTIRNSLSQPGQYVSNEKVEIIGNRSSGKFSILGPERSKTQVELSLSDARALGIEAPVRESGDIKGSGTCKIKGPAGEIEIKEGVIVAKRHIHMTEKDAKDFNVKNGDIVKVETNSVGRKLIFDDVVIRVRNDFSLAMHIDTDEANATFGATEVKIIK